MAKPRGAAGLLACALVLAACGDDPEPGFERPAQLADPVAASRASPFDASCSGPAGDGGTRFTGSEVEPSLAIHPVNPDHLVAAWQQDRWSNGGADGIVAAVSLDGGATWTASPVPFSRCGVSAGGTAGDASDFDRTTDPWVSFSADGSVVHVIGFSFDQARVRRAILVSHSTDGGLTWTAARALALETNPDFLVDKPTLTADPARAGAVYAIWDRLTGQTTPDDPERVSGPAWFSRSLDGGVTWDEPRIAYDPGADAQTIASQIVVLPDGALVNVFVRVFQATREDILDAELVAMRSEDQGESWSAPVVIAELLAEGARVPETDEVVRAGEVVPSSTVDPDGRIFVTWQDGRFSGGARDGIAVSSSADGGRTWSAPAQVNGAPAVQAFRPSVAAGSGGVAVTYYDFRSDVPGDREHAWTTVWRATSTDGGATWRDTPEGGPFDLRLAPDTGGFFVGDYTGLAPRREAFAALFPMTGGTGPTDVFVTPPVAIVTTPGR